MNDDPNEIFSDAVHRVTAAVLAVLVIAALAWVSWDALA